MIRKKFKKGRKKVRDLVPANMSEKVDNLNPLNKKEEAHSLENVPRITNETIAVHREEVLKGARKYIYPLQHSKHRIIVLTASILSAAIIVFFIYSLLALYKLNQYNTFLYRTTQVVPFPVARIGDTFVAYENYLFDLRHYIHYYQTQLGSDFNGNDKDQLLRHRKQALDDVINSAYIKKLAKQNKVGVSSKEVEERINQMKDQNRLGSNNKVFADVLNDYWGWSIADFKRSLKEQILSEKVAAKLDTQTSKKAEAALTQVRQGADFANLASQVSDEPTSKAAGGDYGFVITKTNPNISPQVVSELFRLRAGEVSGLINTGSTLEIVKIVQTDGNAVTAKHIVFNVKDISGYTKQERDKKPPHVYVNL